MEVCTCGTTKRPTSATSRGEVFNAIRADQNLKNVESRDFGVFEDLSSLTMPKLRAV